MSRFAPQPLASTFQLSHGFLYSPGIIYAKPAQEQYDYRFTYNIIASGPSEGRLCSLEYDYSTATHYPDNCNGDGCHEWGLMKAANAGAYHIKLMLLFARVGTIFAISL